MILRLSKTAIIGPNPEAPEMTKTLRRFGKPTRVWPMRFKLDSMHMHRNHP